MRGKFSLYETRIFAKIVESVQDVIKSEGGVSLVIGRKISSDGLNEVFECRIKDLLNAGAHRYEDIKNALTSLQSKKVVFQDEKKQLYKSSYFINNFVWDSQNGKVTISVPKWLLALILDFKAGASIYDLDIALSFRRATTVRLYMLLCGQKKPITYKISFLRSILGVDEAKYSQTRDFIKRLVLPAKKEMDDRGSNSFDLTVNKASDAYKAPIVSLTFRPIKRELQTKESIASRISLSNVCPMPLQRYLTMQAGFEVEELKRNKVTLFEFSRLGDYQDRIVKIVERARKGRKNKGYIIAAMRSEVEQNTNTKWK